MEKYFTLLLDGQTMDLKKITVWSSRKEMEKLKIRASKLKRPPTR